MSDPKLKRTTVVVGYSCDDGFSKKSTFKSTKEVPHKGLLSAIYELSRMAALYGVSDLADEAYSTAKDNVAELLSLKEIAHNSEEVSKQMQEDLGVSLMKKPKTVSVWCCECDCHIEVEEVQQVGSYITCQECGNVHEVDSDYNEVGAPFWYLVSV